MGLVKLWILIDEKDCSSLGVVVLRVSGYLYSKVSQYARIDNIDTSDRQEYKCKIISSFHSCISRYIAKTRQSNAP